MLDRLYDRFEDVGRSLGGDESPSTRFRAAAALLILSAIVLAARYAAGSFPITLFPDDAMHALGQADYLVRGARPYVDYYSLHGPFPFAFVAAGIKAYGISFDAFMLGQMLAAVVLGGVMWRIAVTRVHPYWAVALAVSVELLLVACTPLGRRTWREFSAAMWYNTVGFVLMAIVFAYVLLPSRSPSKAGRWVDALLVAFCLAASFATKMPLFLVLTVVFVVGTVIAPSGGEKRIHGIAALVMTAGMIGVGAAWLTASIPAYFAFLGTIAMKVHPLAFALRYVQYTRTLGLLALSMLAIGWLARQAGVLNDTWREWLLAALMTGGMAVVASTSKQDPEALPLLGLIPLGVAVATAAAAKAKGRQFDARLAAIALTAALLLVVNDAKNGALSLGFAHLRIKTLGPAVEHLALESVANVDGIVSDRVDRRIFAVMPKDWVEHTLAGLEMLNDAGARAGDTLYVAAYSSALTALTDLERTHGESPWSPFGFAANPIDVPPMADDLLVDADWILRDLDVPDAWRNLSHYRREYIDREFEVVERSDEWILYGRRTRERPARNGADD